MGLGSVNNTADSEKNVLSATKLTTARTLWGQSFDGTASLSGEILDASYLQLSPLRYRIAANSPGWYRVANYTGPSGAYNRQAFNATLLINTAYNASQPEYHKVLVGRNIPPA